MKYYYDSEAKVPDAIDPETEDVRILEPIDFETMSRSRGASSTLNRQRPAKAECGSLSRHKKTCSKASSSKKEKPSKPESKKLNRLDFDVVKEQQANDQVPDYVASRFDLDIAEVKDAFASVDYRTYKVL